MKNFYNKPYGRKYDKPDRWTAYSDIVEYIKDLGECNKILELGCGNKTMSNYFKQFGYEVTTFDFDKELKPDYLVDMRTWNNDNPNFKENQFDIVLASMSLEHISYKDTIKMLKIIKKISKFSVIALPLYSVVFSFSFKIPFFDRKDFLIHFPMKWFMDVGHDTLDEWELGENISVKRWEKDLDKLGFTIMKKKINPLYPRYWIYQLKNKGESYSHCKEMK